MSPFLLELLPFVAVLSAIFVITAVNPILGVLFLIAVFITVSAYLALLGLTFLALSYLIIYVGAIAILFLFVIMMLDIKLAELSSSGEEASKVYPVAFLIGTPFLWTLTGSPLFRGDTLYSWFDQTTLGIAHISDPSSLQWTNLFAAWQVSNIHSLGICLYTIYPLWLIYAGIILLLAIIGPIILCLDKTSGSTS
jgi:NADH-ubiquinone oxidoreductase chain 6